jgi:hypothetical protein
MPQDHYVAQTYLRKWCDPANRDHLHVYRKSDLKYFPAHPYTVCREKGGDRIVGWLDDEMALGNFRKMFEPGWAEAVEAAAVRRLTPEHKLVIAGYWANLLATTPQMQALGIEFFKSKDEEYWAQRAAEGVHPPETLESREIRFDANFVKAFATDSILSSVWRYYHGYWLVLFNDTPHPFLTSDAPAAAAPAPGGHGVYHFLPLSPRLCITMLVTEDIASPEEWPSFPAPPKGDIRYEAATKQVVTEINRAIIKFARDLVFSVKANQGIARLVENFRDHAVQNVVVKGEDGVSRVIGMQVEQRNSVK